MRETVQRLITTVRASFKLAVERVFFLDRCDSQLEDIQWYLPLLPVVQMRQQRRDH